MVRFSKLALALGLSLWATSVLAQLVPADRVLCRDTASPNPGQIEYCQLSGGLGFTGSVGLTVTLAGDVDGTGNANDLDEAAVETELESVLDLADLQGSLTLAGDVDGAHGSNDLDEVAVEAELESVIDLADLQGDLALGTKTSGNYVETVADGTGIDGTATGEGSTYTPVLDLTEINSATFGNGAFTALTFDAGAVDPVLTASSGKLKQTTGGFGVTGTDGATTYGAAAQITLETTNPSGVWGQAQAVFSADSTGPGLAGFKSRNAAIGGHTVVQNGDGTLELWGFGSDGTDYEPTSYIILGVDGEPATAGDPTDMPGNITFGTTTDGTDVTTARWQIDSAGVFKPFTDGSYDIGTTTLGVNNFFADTGFVFNWENGDCLLTHSSNSLALTGSCVLTSDSSLDLSGVTTATLTASGADLLIEGTAAVKTSRTLTGGTGVAAIGDLSLDRTISLDLTELNSFTLGAGAATGIIFDAGATDPAIETASGSFTIDIGGTDEVTLTASAFSPGGDAGSSLGTTALGWNDLHLDTGATINIENGDWVATHTAGILTVGTGELRITTPGTNAASVPTLGSTSTFSNKSFSTQVSIAGTAASFFALQTSTTDAGTSGVIQNMFHDSASPAANDIIGRQRFTGNDDGAAQEVYVDFRGVILDPTAGSEDGIFQFFTDVAGTLTKGVTFRGGGLVTGATADQDAGAGGIVADSNGTIRLAEAEANGDNYQGFITAAAITADTTCTFENDANFIPDSCVGDGVDASDGRLKDIIGPAGDVGALIDGIKIYDYEWIADAPNASEDVRKGKRGFGPVAQELFNVNADWVHVGGDDPIADPWTWKPEKLVPYLIVEIQALRKRVAELEAR